MRGINPSFLIQNFLQSSSYIKSYTQGTLKRHIISLKVVPKSGIKTYIKPVHYTDIFFFLFLEHLYFSLIENGN